MKLLITGISGFIGCSLGAYFAAKGAHIIGFSRREILSPFASENVKTNYRPAEIARLVRRFRPDVIIHAAGPSSVRDSFKDPAEDFSKSVVLFHSLLEGIRMSGIRPLVIFPSSAAVYGNPASLPVSESAPLKPISPYGYHKVLCEKLAEEYAELYSIPSLVVRLFSVFGTRQKRLLVWELFDQFRNRKEVVVEGTGNESRDYIHVDDVARLLEKLLSGVKEKYLIVNVAAGRAVSVKELAYLMKEILNSGKPIVFQGKVRLGDPLKWQADVVLYEAHTAGKVDLDFRLRLRSCLLEWSEPK
ncbi:MAG TPA: SDR family oxidoreductase [Desulfomonilaceae bacterium]|nr:SDR family oxidoreductase [Desulfomonilaceae bacterium]HVN96288.1 SDR family oxidoreductase [Syntrophorhabdaceae bacterium]